MANYIDWAGEIDRYWRHHDVDNPWAQVLDTISRQTTEANARIGQYNIQSQKQARQAAQTTTSELYGQYLQGRKALAGSSQYSETFKTGVEAAIGPGTVGQALAQTYQTGISAATTIAPLATTPPVEYTQDTEKYGKAFESVFTYLSGGTPDFGGMLTQDKYGSAELTAQGLMDLKYYMLTEGAEKVEGEGGLYKYLTEQGIAWDPSIEQTLGEIFDVDLSSPVFTESERKRIFGSSVSAKTIDRGGLPKRGVDNLPKVWQTREEEAIGRDMVPKWETNPLSNIAEAFAGDGAIDGYILNKKESDDLMSWTENRTIAKGIYKSALEGETDVYGRLKVNGIPAREAIQKGALRDGDVFRQDGISYIVYGNELRVYLDKETLNTLWSMVDDKYLKKELGEDYRKADIFFKIIGQERG